MEQHPSADQNKEKALEAILSTEVAKKGQVCIFIHLNRFSFDIIQVKTI